MQCGNTTDGARVTVELDWDVLEAGVRVELVAAGEGAPVESPEVQRWIGGAMHGVRFAITAANSMPCLVRVTELAVGPGTTTTHVAAAAALAVWEALGLQPDPEVRERLDRRVAESRDADEDWLGDFGAD